MTRARAAAAERARLSDEDHAAGQVDRLIDQQRRSQEIVASLANPIDTEEARTDVRQLTAMTPPPHRPTDITAMTPAGNDETDHHPAEHPRTEHAAVSPPNRTTTPTGPAESMSDEALHEQLSRANNCHPEE